VVAECQASAVKLHDARRAALQHFHRLADTHAQLFQAMHFIGPTNQLINPRALTSGEHLQRKRIGHGRTEGGQAVESLLKLSLTML